MSFLSGLLPDVLLRPMASSAHSTLAISNLPGPTGPIMFQNFNVDKLTFWLPNRGTTGMGISLFSYNDYLHLGIIADENLISNDEDLNSILFMIKQSLYEM